MMMCMGYIYTNTTVLEWYVVMQMLEKHIIIMHLQSLRMSMVHTHEITYSMSPVCFTAKDCNALVTSRQRASEQI